LKKGKIVIIDYGMGNLGSIQNILRHVGADSIVSSLPSDIESADKLILSGVGAFDSAVKKIHDMALLSVLSEQVLENKIPILGICLGMQLFTTKSEEGELPGFGWIEGKTVKFRFDTELQKLKIPHMGWNIVHPRKESKLFHNMPEGPRFYFVHSYHVLCKNQEDVLCVTHYGYDFGSAIEKDNIYGTQFHPEKSHKFGMQLVKNFTELV